MSFLKLIPLLLICALTGCSGDIVKGLPKDGGDDEETTGDQGSDAGVTVVRDARVADAKVTSDSGSSTNPGSVTDAGGSTTQPQDSGTTQPMTGKDASTPPPTQADAGTPPASGRDFSTDKTKFTGNSRCDSKVLFCDDFEQTVGGNPGAAYSYPFGFMPKIDMTRAQRGTRSLKFSVPAGTAGHVEIDQLFPAANNTIYGRMFVWVDAFPTAPQYAHYTFVGASGTGNAAEVRLDGQLAPLNGGTNANQLGIGSDGGDSGDWHTPGTESQSVPANGTWTCLEWMFKGSSNETQVWIDDVEQTSLHLNATNYRRGSEGGKQFIMPTFTKIRIGWWWYDATNAAPSTTNVWIDELAMDSSRIGCVY